MRRIISILPLVFSLSMAVAPSASAAPGNGSLSGSVMAPDGKGLIGAVVALFKQDDAGAVISLTKSDQRGTYSLNDIAPGFYSLRVSRIGYQVLNSPRVTINAGKTTTVNFVLQELLDFISVRNDPRNWDLKTVMRSTSDRRLIFRSLPGSTNPEESGEAFRRNGSVQVVSNGILGGDNYATYPNQGDAGIISNFAFSEPVSQHSRMILSGQLTSGYDSLWRVRNTFDYRPEPSRDLKFSFGYGRMNLNRLSAGTAARPADFFSQDPAVRDSGMETLAMGFQASNEFFNTLAMEYGLDLSRVNYGTTRTMWSPYFQVVVTPYRGWLLRTLMTSRRVSDNDSIELPDGETVNLLEPANVSKIDNQINISQVRHSELAVARKLAEDTSLEVTVYRDRVDGPGTPFLMSYTTKSGKKSSAVQLRSDQDAQQGLRVAFASMLMSTVQGSITYDYGTAAAITRPSTPVSTDLMVTRLLDYIHRSYYHSVTSQLEAKIPQTGTHVQATLRWYPGDPISPIDLFADRLDTFTKGMSFSLRQAIPLPDFLGCAGHWEALIDLRNPFNQGSSLIPTSDGELTLTRNPRTLRFGLNLNFN
ncbi:MAG: carboxypeptidase-like regulatory domain-containing protein [Acidobacteriota bacterium]